MPIPSHIDPTVRQALQDALVALRAVYGERLQQMILFGSQARGDAHAESDVDVLVVLGGEVSYLNEVRRMLDVKMHLLNVYDVLFSFKPVSAATYREGQQAFLRTVRKEGAKVA